MNCWMEGRTPMRALENNRHAAISNEQYAAIGVRLDQCVNHSPSPYSCSPPVRRPRRTLPRNRSQHGDIDVAVRSDAGGTERQREGHRAEFTRRREVVWSLITSCAEAVSLVPGLVDL